MGRIRCLFKEMCSPHIRACPHAARANTWRYIFKLFVRYISTMVYIIKTKFILWQMFCNRRSFLLVFSQNEKQAQSLVGNVLPLLLSVNEMPSGVSLEGPFAFRVSLPWPLRASACLSCTQRECPALWRKSLPLVGTWLYHSYPKDVPPAAIKKHCFTQTATHEAGNIGMLCRQ